MQGELRRTGSRVLSASMSLQVRPVEDQPINVRVDGGEWVKAKITLVKPLNVRNPVFESPRWRSAADMARFDYPIEPMTPFVR
jgi:hypothetical protein